MLTSQPFSADMTANPELPALTEPVWLLPLHIHSAWRRSWYKALDAVTTGAEIVALRASHPYGQHLAWEAARNGWNACGCGCGAMAFECGG